jgi:hypothetical protein
VLVFELLLSADDELLSSPLSSIDFDFFPMVAVAGLLVRIGFRLLLVVGELSLDVTNVSAGVDCLKN